MKSPSAGAIWETFVFAQLRHRERRSGRSRGLFFWRDRTREVDFVVETGDGVELYEAKWTELPNARDAVNLDFVRRFIRGKGPVRAAVVGRLPHRVPLEDDVDAIGVGDLA
jgi:predicted AAA+ superfamily ATPase